MKRRRILILVTVWGGVAGALAWGLAREVTALERAKARLAARENEWRMLAGAAEEDGGAIEAEIRRSEEEAGRLWVASGLGRREAPEVKRTEEAFFEIAEFVKRMRARAEGEGVKVRDEERFGFEEFSNAGPEAAELETVLKQVRLAEAVLEALFEAEPREIEGGRRGRARREADGAGAARRGVGETFEVERGLSLAEPGRFATTAYRVRFVGKTATLRRFLNRMAEVPAAIAVRAVEVDLKEAAVTENETARVRSTWSRFTVSLEQVEWVAAEERGGGRAGEVRAGGGFRWGEPVCDDEWAYDVFTPPDIFYDAASGRLSVVKRKREEKVGIQNLDTAAEGAEIEPAVVRPFRLQLLGFVGEAGQYRGLFEDGETAELFLGAAGQRWERAAAAIEALEVERAEVAWPESMAIRMPVVKARVRDERSGEVVWLTSGERVVGAR